MAACWTFNYPFLTYYMSILSKVNFKELEDISVYQMPVRLGSTRATFPSSSSHWSVSEPLWESYLVIWYIFTPESQTEDVELWHWEFEMYQPNVNRTRREGWVRIMIFFSYLHHSLFQMHLFFNNNYTIHSPKETDFTSSKTIFTGVQGHQQNGKIVSRFRVAEVAALISLDFSRGKHYKW